MCENTLLLSLGEASLLSVTFRVNWQQMCTQLHFHFEPAKIILSVGPWQTPVGWMGDAGDLLRVLLPIECHAEAQSQSSMERAVFCSRILNTGARACFEMLPYLLVTVPTDISPSPLSKWSQRKIPLGWAFPAAGACVCCAPMCHRFM